MPFPHIFSDGANWFQKLSISIQICVKLGLCVWPIINIAIGAAYLNDCPVQQYIPIYLIVSRIFCLLLVVLSCLPCCESLLLAWNLLTFCFVITWFIAGNAWIYSIYEPNYNKNTTSTDLYCNKTLYLFAFSSLTIVYILLGLTILVILVLLLRFCVCNVWIYSIYEPNYNKNTTSTDLYCNKTLYLFAFWNLTIVYILLGLAILVGLILILHFCVCKRSCDI